jgi:hypothetical protein
MQPGRLVETARLIYPRRTAVSGMSLSRQLRYRVLDTKLLAFPFGEFEFVRQGARRLFADRALEVGVFIPETPDTIFNSHMFLS